MRWSTAAAVLLVVVVASLALNAYQYSVPRSVTITKTVTTTCVQSVSNATNALATDCKLGITLGLWANPTISMGSNQTVRILVKNDLSTPNRANFTGLPTLPHGLGLLNDTLENYVLPEVLGCGTTAPAYSGLAFIAVYNASGVPLQMNIMEPCILAQPIEVQPPFQFNASQTIGKSVSVGGYWMSADRSEPWINATYHRLAPGSYTIVAFDLWKQLAELNFKVSRT